MTTLLSKLEHICKLAVPGREFLLIRGPTQYKNNIDCKINVLSKDDWMGLDGIGWWPKASSAHQCNPANDNDTVHGSGQESKVQAHGLPTGSWKSGGGKAEWRSGELAETETQRWREWSHEHYLCKITFNEVTSWRSVLLHYHYRNKLWSFRPSPAASASWVLHLRQVACKIALDSNANYMGLKMSAAGRLAAWLPGVLVFWQAAGVLDSRLVAWFSGKDDKARVTQQLECSKGIAAKWIKYE